MTSTPPPETSSPLSTEKPDSISELFNRPWNEWNKSVDLPRMVETLRAWRAKLGNLEEKPKRATTPKIDTKDLEGKSPEEVLNALGLDLG